MATKKMIDALNDQLNFEAYSGYIYLAMAAQCEQEGMKGAANWLFCQMQEEQTHALRFWKYVNSLGEYVALKQIDGPQTRFESVTRRWYPANCSMRSLSRWSPSPKTGMSSSSVSWPGGSRMANRRKRSWI